MWRMEQVREEILSFNNTESPNLVWEIGTKVFILLL